VAECGDTVPLCHEDPERHTEDVASFTVPAAPILHHADRAQPPEAVPGQAPVRQLNGKAQGRRNVAGRHAPRPRGRLARRFGVAARSVPGSAPPPRRAAVPCRGRPLFQPWPLSLNDTLDRDTTLRRVLDLQPAKGNRIKVRVLGRRSRGHSRSPHRHCAMCHVRHQTWRSGYEASRGREQRQATSTTPNLREFDRMRPFRGSWQIETSRTRAPNRPESVHLAASHGTDALHAPRASEQTPR
jgi:hypothetical protein